MIAREPRLPARVYISGPYTLGDVEANVRNAILAGAAVRDAGHVPYIPHLMHYWDKVSPRPWGDWMGICLAEVRRSDAMIRLPGESRGADLEVELAQKRGLQVFAGVREFLKSVGYKTSAEIDEDLRSVARAALHAD